MPDEPLKINVARALCISRALKPCTCQEDGGVCQAPKPVLTHPRSGVKVQTDAVFEALRAPTPSMLDAAEKVLGGVSPCTAEQVWTAMLDAAQGRTP